MHQRIIKTLIVVFISIQPLTAQHFQTGSPEWLVDTFFRQPVFDNKASYYSDEMVNYLNKPSAGEELKGKAEISFHQIQADNNACVFAIEIITEKKVIDFYCYLIKESDSWKISAVRRFLLPDFLYAVHDSLLTLSSLSSSDSSLLKTITLFIKNDDELKNFVNEHLEDLNELVSFFSKKNNESVNKKLNELGCSAVFLDKNYAGCIFVQIASYKKMEAGFIYASGSAKLPVMSEKKFIYIEEVLTGWYLYRIM